jgi:hypothetical protein
MIDVKEPFKIFVGPSTRVSEAIFGEPEPGMASLKPGTVEDRRQIGDYGQSIFPNYFEAWGRRVVLGKDGKIKTEKTEKVSVNSPEYQGVIDFMKYGEPGGEIIYCRYVKGCSSLDYQYQVNRLNLVPKERDEENLWFSLNNGENEVNPNLDPALALALKVHPYNANSICRGGNISHSSYKEIQRVVEEEEDDVFDAQFEAMKMLNEASARGEKDVEALFAILNRNGDILYEPDEAGGMYKALKRFVVNDCHKALELVKTYKMEASSIIEQGRSANAYVLDKKTLFVGTVNRVPILTEVKQANVTEALQYLLDICVTAEGHEAINKIFQKKQENFK